STISAFFDEFDILGIVNEPLGHYIFGTGLNLIFKSSNILLYIWSFHVLFGISRYSYAEIGMMSILQALVMKYSLMHTRNLLHQVICKIIAVGLRFIIGFTFYGISAQGHNIFNSKEIKIY